VVGDVVEVDGIVLVPEGTNALLVHADGGPFVIDATQAALRAVAGLDPDLGVARVRGRVEPTADHPPGDWAAATAAGSRALAHEMLGVADRALVVAIEHVTARRQFGRPIATFQAVRHRLVDVHVAIAAARAVLTGTQDDPGDALAALVGKALAGTAVRAAVQAAQQVCGAMGFTWEHGLHRAVRRAHVLDSLLGRGAALDAEIGARLVALGRAPRLTSL
jgi:alkylation response protein AidB-like acyl-CoA dehydrogenase